MILNGNLKHHWFKYAYTRTLPKRYTGKARLVWNTDPIKFINLIPAQPSKQTTVFHLENESGSWLALLCPKILGGPIPSNNVRNQAMMLFKFFLYWCDALAQFCLRSILYGQNYTSYHAKLTEMSSSKEKPLLISSSGAQQFCKSNTPRLEKVWWQLT